MSKKAIRYTEGEIGKIGPVLKDFLPPQDKLVLRRPIGALTWIVPIILVGGVLAWLAIRWLG